MSSATIRDELFDIAPEFETTEPGALSKVDRFIVRAQRYVSQEVAGSEYDTLVAYKTAELMTLAKPTASSSESLGALLKEKVDNAEYTYANADDVRMKRAQGYRSEFEERMSVLCVGGFITSNGGC